MENKDKQEKKEKRPVRHQPKDLDLRKEQANKVQGGQTVTGGTFGPES